MAVPRSGIHDAADVGRCASGTERNNGLNPHCIPRINGTQRDSEGLLRCIPRFAAILWDGTRNQARSALHPTVHRASQDMFRWHADESVGKWRFPGVASMTRLTWGDVQVGRNAIMASTRIASHESVGRNAIHGTLCIASHDLPRFRGMEHEISILRQKSVDEFTTPQSRFAGQLVLQAWTRYARHPAGSPVVSHVAYKQLCCLPNGNVLTRGANNIINELLTQNTRLISLFVPRVSVKPARRNAIPAGFGIASHGAATSGLSHE